MPLSISVSYRYLLKYTIILIYRGSPPLIVYRDLSYPDYLLSLIGDPVFLGAFSSFVYLYNRGVELSLVSFPPFF